jgi:hypothetical protein
VPTQDFPAKIIQKTFASYELFTYLCQRYPENNLFTLKELIPIEDESDCL